MRLLTMMLFLTGAVEAQERYKSAQSGGFITLSDETGGLEARINPQAGGELCGLRFRFRGEWVELLYRACDYAEASGWRGKAPLLWPATGATLPPGETPGGPRAGTYELQGKPYSMPFHGFAQNMPWKVEMAAAGKRSADAVLSLTDTDQSRKYYPFGFTLTVEYRVSEGRLTMAYLVRSAAQNSGKMLFSIGNHITFRNPFVKGSDPAKMRLETPAGLMLIKDKNNLPTGETKPPPFPGSVLAGNLTANPVISLGGYREDPVVVLLDPQGLRLRMKHSAQKLPPQPYVQINLWTDNPLSYISPEPWVGAQNSLHSRRGLLELGPGEQWQWSILIELSEAARM
jgi:galactose mutarotase-like enzyme